MTHKPRTITEQPNGCWRAVYDGRTGFFTNEKMARAWIADQELYDNPKPMPQADGDPAED